MKLILEIGNSSTKLAVCNGFKISNINYLENIDNSRFLVNLNSIIKNLVLKKPNINQIVISYVNRKIMTKIKKNLINKFPNLKLNILKEKKYKNFKIKYKNIDSFGLDRFFNCLGARTLNNKTGSIVVDIGTATTFDVISSDFEYLGGLIIPGPVTSFSSLLSNTSMIGKYDLNYKSGILGKSTHDCLSIGFTQGNSKMIESLVLNIVNKFGKSYQTFITGGLTDIFKKYLPKKYIFDKLLTLKGIALYIKDYDDF